MPREVLEMESTESPLVCADNCGQRSGYTNLGDKENPWWVAAKCKRPTLLWLKVQGDTVVNIFSGGPLDGLAYTTSTLLREVEFHSLITQYRWTPETKVSSVTGRKARVWRHSLLTEPDTVTQGSTTSPTGGTITMTEQTTQESQATEPAPIDTSGLEAKREKLGVSRQKVADASDGRLTVAKVYRLERGAGKRTSADEVEAYEKALEILAARASEEEAAKNTEGTVENPGTGPDPS
jgi:hypothetical protein